MCRRWNFCDVKLSAKFFVLVSVKLSFIIGPVVIVTIALLATSVTIAIFLLQPRTTYIFYNAEWSVPNYYIFNGVIVTAKGGIGLYSATVSLYDHTFPCLNVSVYATKKENNWRSYYWRLFLMASMPQLIGQDGIIVRMIDHLLNNLTSTWHMKLLTRLGWTSPLWIS